MDLCEVVIVPEKLHNTVNTDDLSEYDRFLLDALLQQAATDAGKTLSVAARREITALSH